jgi:hypothetical protein
MTDRELLELAAKAAGILVYWHNSKQSFVRVPSPRWNPLTDDGDALRLAVKLKIQITPGTYQDYEVTAYRGGCCEATEKATVGYSLEEATRRAIVRAAAEIEKGIIRQVSDDLPEDNYYKTHTEDDWERIHDDYVMVAREVLKEAEEFIDRHSESWYVSGQATLLKLRAALEVNPANPGTPTFSSGFIASVPALYSTPPVPADQAARIAELEAKLAASEEARKKAEKDVASTALRNFADSYCWDDYSRFYRDELYKKAAALTQKDQGKENGE